MDPPDTVAPRITLRPVEEADLARLVRMLWDPDAPGEHEWFGFRMPAARAIERRWREDGLIGAEASYLAVEDEDGSCAGCVTWRPVGATGALECGIGLFPEHRGRGVGTEAQRLLVDHLFATTPVHRLQAGTEVGNVAEQRALERVGFRREGVQRGHHFRDGRWRDSVMYGLLRDDRAAATAPTGAPGGDLAAVRERRRILAETGSDEGPERGRGPGDVERVSLPRADGDALRDLLVADGARRVIEIGLAYGGSALAIGEALLLLGGPTEHLIVDAFQHRFHEAGVEAIAAAGLAARCTLLRERSQLALPRLVAGGVEVDAAFVDGSHVFHNVFVDLSFLRELVRPGGLIVLDDCDRPPVATAVRYFARNTGWRPHPADRPTRLRAYRLPDPRPEPALEEFTPFAAGEDAP